jgi:catechol 2,3-dioxygenase-like lactoylglutathione lyase family enzyme
MTTQYKSSVLFVQDIKQSRDFYENLIGLEVEMDFGPNVGYVGGLAIWQVDHAHQTIFGQARYGSSQMGQSNCELYFEADELDAIWKTLSSKVRVVHPIMEQSWGQRVFRVYDPDGHIVEFGEPIPVFVRRFLDRGMSIEDTAKRTGIPVPAVQAMADGKMPVNGSMN